VPLYVAICQMLPHGSSIIPTSTTVRRDSGLFERQGAGFQRTLVGDIGVVDIEVKERGHRRPRANAAHHDKRVPNFHHGRSVRSEFSCRAERLPEELDQPSHVTPARITDQSKRKGRRKHSPKVYDRSRHHIESEPSAGGCVSPNIEIRFVSRRFVIEQAALWLYRLQRDRQKTILSTTTGHSLELTSSPDERALEDLASNFPTLGVVNGSVYAPIDRPGLVEGILFGIRTCRSSGAITTHGLAEFVHEVTEEDLYSGATTINMDGYREVVIKVRDREGRPAGGGQIIGLARLSKEGGLDLAVDEHGEARLLLAPGIYATTGGQFEITSSDAEDIVEVTVPARLQNPTGSDH
jgi:hypothetical protein